MLIYSQRDIDDEDTYTYNIAINEILSNNVLYIPLVTM
jgi:hypothetical protein